MADGSVVPPPAMLPSWPHLTGARRRDLKLLATFAATTLCSLATDEPKNTCAYALVHAPSPGPHLEHAATPAAAKGTLGHPLTSREFFRPTNDKICDARQLPGSALLRLLRGSSTSTCARAKLYRSAAASGSATGPDIPAALKSCCNAFNQ